MTEKVATSEPSVCLGATQATLTDDKALSGVGDDTVDPKPGTAPVLKPKREPSTASTSNCITSTPDDLMSVDTNDTTILPSEQVDSPQEDADSKQCADDSKAGIVKLETLDTPSLQYLDVKPEPQPEVLPLIPKSLRQPRQKRHDKSPGILDPFARLWDDLRQSSATAEDVSVLDPTVENADNTAHKKKIIGSYKNPAAKTGKVKKNAINLSLDSVYDRIATVGHGVYDIKLPDSLKFQAIKRQFLSDVYGGNMQATLSFPKKSFVEKHGIKCFMCLITEYNPYAPLLPGAPGLGFGDGQYAEWPRNPERVFTRTGEAEWLYQGDYKLVRCASLTPAEYRGLSKTARDTWSNGAISSAGWGMAVRARILLRKELKHKRLKRKPTTQEVKAKMTFLKANQHLKPVTAEEVDKAYSSGKEVICVWAMKCVAYDVEFQRTMIERFNTWVPPEPKEKKSKGKEAKSSKGRGKASTKSPAKRRRPRSPSIISSDSDGSNDNIRTLGTKSRPAKRIRFASEVF
ncbi:hypothetical protein BD410DRAFT_900856 [Rickenella mellea]|uniref:DUF6697 domain-containing protein n=1 Tax=Rickenella mellea TaxID=50990 RepID=A0A4Y7PSL5_9AGAM|nr:hypothetical protein BD410DRAFT_900856 [Rickenella mellea]